MAINYLKNVVKSLAFTAAESVTSIAPNVSEFAENNKESLQAITNVVFHPTNQVKRAISAVANSKVFEAVGYGYDNLLKDISTGNFYDNQRKEAAVMQAMGMDDFDMSGDDWDFGNFEDELNSDTSDANIITAGDKLISQSVEGSVQAATNATLKAVMASGKAGMKNIRLTAGILYQQNEKIYGAMHNDLSTIGGTLKTIFDFQKTTLGNIDKNLASFQTESLKLDTERNEILKKQYEFLQEQAKTAKELEAKATEDSKKYRKTNFSDVVSYSGMPNLGEYFEKITKSVGETFGFFTEEGGLLDMLKAEYLSNPLRTALGWVGKQLIPEDTKEIIGDLDKLVTNIFPSFISLMNRSANNYSNDPITRAIAGWLGLSTGVNDKIDTSKYEKGKVAWDGMTRKAVMEVIPEYLSRIESAITGNEQQLYDYNTGRWRTYSAIQKEEKDLKINTINNNISDLNEKMIEGINNYVNTLAQKDKDSGISEEEIRNKSNETNKELRKALDQFNTYWFDRVSREDSFKPAVFRKDQDVFINKEANPELDKYFDTLVSILQSTNNKEKLIPEANKGIMQATEDIDRYYRDKENSGFSIERQLAANKSDDIKLDRLTKANITTYRDEHNHTIYSYLYTITTELHRIRMGGAIGAPVNRALRGSAAGRSSIDDAFVENAGKQDIEYVARKKTEKEKKESSKFTSTYGTDSDFTLKREILLFINRSDPTNDLIDLQKYLEEDKKLSFSYTAKNYILYLASIVRKGNKSLDDLKREFTQYVTESANDSSTRFEKSKFSSFLNKNIINMGIKTSANIDEAIKAVGTEVTADDGTTRKIEKTYDKGAFYTFTDKILDKIGISGVRRTIAGWTSGFNNTLRGWVDSTNAWIYNLFFGESLKDPETGERYDSFLELIGAKASSMFKTFSDQITKSFRSLKEYLGIDDDDFKSRFKSTTKGILGGMWDMVSNATNRVIIDPVSGLVMSGGGTGSSLVRHIAPHSWNRNIAKMSQEDFNKLSDEEKYYYIKRRKEALEEQPEINLSDYEDEEGKVEKELRIAGFENAADILGKINRGEKIIVDGTEVNNLDDLSEVYNKRIAKNARESYLKYDLGFNYGTNIESYSKALSKLGVSEEKLKEIIEKVNTTEEKLIELQEARIELDREKHVLDEAKYNEIDEEKKKEREEREAESEGLASGTFISRPFTGLTMLTRGEKVITGQGTIADVPKTGAYELINSHVLNNRQSAAFDRALGVQPLHDISVEQAEKEESAAEKRIFHHAEGTSFNIDDLRKVSGKKIKFSDEAIEIAKTAKKLLPELAAGGLVGGGISLILGLTGGPLLGAAVGAGSTLIYKSAALQNILFGDLDKETGKRKDNGLISMKIQDTIKKYVPDMADYGIAGALSSLLLPYGPIAGSMIGASIGFIKNNDAVRKTLFGKLGWGSKKQTDIVSKFLPNTIKGGILGGVATLFGGPFGVLGNAAIGSAIGMMTASDEFKTMLLGVKDRDGNRVGGVWGAIKDAFQPLKDSLIDFKDRLLATLNNNVLNPLGRFIRPAIMEIPHLAGLIPKKINDWLDKGFGIRLDNVIRRWVIEPIKRSFKPMSGFASKMFEWATTPIRAFGFFGDRLRKRQIEDRRATDMTAEERVKFMKDNKYQVDAFDEFLMGIGSKDFSVEQAKNLSQNLKDLISNKRDVKKAKTDTANKIYNLLSTYTSVDGSKIAPKTLDLIRHAIDNGQIDRIPTILQTSMTIDGAFTRGLSMQEIDELRKAGLDKELATYTNLNDKLNTLNGETKDQADSRIAKAKQKLNKVLGSNGIDVNLNDTESVSKIITLLDNEIDRVDKEGSIKVESAVIDGSDKIVNAIKELADTLINYAKDVSMNDVTRNAYNQFNSGMVRAQQNEGKIFAENIRRNPKAYLGANQNMRSVLQVSRKIPKTISNILSFGVESNAQNTLYNYNPFKLECINKCLNNEYIAKFLHNHKLTEDDLNILADVGANRKDLLRLNNLCKFIIEKGYEEDYPTILSILEAWNNNDPTFIGSSKYDNVEATEEDRQRINQYVQNRREALAYRDLGRSVSFESRHGQGMVITPGFARGTFGYIPHLAEGTERAIGTGAVLGLTGITAAKLLTGNSYIMEALGLGAKATGGAIAGTYGALGSIGAGLLTTPGLIAALGAGALYVAKSKKAQEVLFGKIVDGKRIDSGIIPQNVQKFFKQNVPSLTKGAVLGYIANSIVPFGPIAGPMIGAAASWLESESEFKDKILGGIGLNPKNISKYVKRIKFGGISGTLLGSIIGGPFGPLGNFVLGAGLNLVANSNMFKDFMFGKVGKDGRRHGGVIGNIGKGLYDGITKPLKKAFAPMIVGVKETAKKFKNQFSTWLKKGFSSIFRRVLNWGPFGLLSNFLFGTGPEGAERKGGVISKTLGKIPGLVNNPLWEHMGKGAADFFSGTPSEVVGKMLALPIGAPANLINLLSGYNVNSRALLRQYYKTTDTATETANRLWIPHSILGDDKASAEKFIYTLSQIEQGKADDKTVEAANTIRNLLTEKQNELVKSDDYMKSEKAMYQDYTISQGGERLYNQLASLMSNQNAEEAKIQARRYIADELDKYNLKDEDGGTQRIINLISRFEEMYDKNKEYLDLLSGTSKKQEEIYEQNKEAFETLGLEKRAFMDNKLIENVAETISKSLTEKFANEAEATSNEQSEKLQAQNELNIKTQQDLIAVQKGTLDYTEKLLTENQTYHDDVKTILTNIYERIHVDETPSWAKEEERESELEAANKYAKGTFIPVSSKLQLAHFAAGSMTDEELNKLNEENKEKKEINKLRQMQMKVYGLLESAFGGTDKRKEDTEGEKDAKGRGWLGSMFTRVKKGLKGGASLASKLFGLYLLFSSGVLPKITQAIIDAGPKLAGFIGDAINKTGSWLAEKGKNILDWFSGGKHNVGAETVYDTAGREGEESSRLFADPRKKKPLNMSQLEEYKKSGKPIYNEQGAQGTLNDKGELVFKDESISGSSYAENALLGMWHAYTHPKGAQAGIKLAKWVSKPLSMLASLVPVAGPAFVKGVNFATSAPAKIGVMADKGYKWFAKRSAEKGVEQVVGSVAKNAGKEAAESAIGATTREAGEELLKNTDKSLIGKVVDMVHGLIDKVLNSKLAQAALTKIANFFNKNNVARWVAEHTKKLIVWFKNSVVKASANLLGKAAELFAKVTKVIGTWWIWWTVDIGVGVDQSEAILGVEETTWPEAFMAGLANVLCNTFVIPSIIPGTPAVAQFLYNTLCSEELVKEYKARQDEAKRITDEYNKLHGTTYSTQERLERQKSNTGWLINKTFDVVGDVWDFTKDVVIGTVDTISTGIDWLFGYSDHSKYIQERMRSLKWVYTKELSDDQFRLIYSDTYSTYNKALRLQQKAKTDTFAAEVYIRACLLETKDIVTKKYLSKDQIDELIATYKALLDEEGINENNITENDIIEAEENLDRELNKQSKFEEFGTKSINKEMYGEQASKEDTRTKNEWKYTSHYNDSEFMHRIYFDYPSIYDKALKLDPYSIELYYRSMLITGLDLVSGYEATEQDIEAWKSRYDYIVLHKGVENLSEYGRRVVQRDESVVNKTENIKRQDKKDYEVYKQKELGATVNKAVEEYKQTNDVSKLVEVVSSGTGKYSKMIDPRIAGLRYNSNGDNVYQTIGDSGCGPAAVVNVLESYGKGKKSKFGRGVYDIPALAEQYSYSGAKELDGGTDPMAMANTLQQQGLPTQVTTDKSLMKQWMSAGGKAIWMGENASGVSQYDPWGKGMHYVTQTGLDADGNPLIQDPESAYDDLSYKTNDMLKGTKLGILVGEGKFGRGILGTDESVQQSVQQAITQQQTPKEAVEKAVQPTQEQPAAQPSEGGQQATQSTSTEGAAPSGKYSMEQNALAVRNYLLSKGIAENAVYGILGNMQAESGINPERMEDLLRQEMIRSKKDFGITWTKDRMADSKAYTDAINSGKISRQEFIYPSVGSSAGKARRGYGLVQFTSAGLKGDLYDNTVSKGISIGSLPAQLDSVLRVINSDRSYKSLAEAMKNKELSVEDQAVMFLKKYERPAKLEQTKPVRIQNALNWMRKLTGKPTTEIPQDTTIGTTGQLEDGGSADPSYDRNNPLSFILNAVKDYFMDVLYKTFGLTPPTSQSEETTPDGRKPGTTIPPTIANPGAVPENTLVANSDGFRMINDPRKLIKATGSITSRFGPRKPPKQGASSYHKGVDMIPTGYTKDKRYGHPIAIAADGKITYAGPGRGYGNYVEVTHGNGYTTRYAHLNDLHGIQKGQTVKGGEYLLHMGNTGVGTGPHLHFEVRKDGNPMDPFKGLLDMAKVFNANGTPQEITPQPMKDKNMTDSEKNFETAVTGQGKFGRGKFGRGFDFGGILNTFGSMMTSGKEPTAQELIGNVAGMIPGQAGSIVGQLGNTFGGMLDGGKAPSAQQTISGVAGMLPGPIGGIVSSLGGMLTSGKEPTPQDLIGGISSMIPGGLPGPIGGIANMVGNMMTSGKEPTPQDLIGGISSMIPGGLPGPIGGMVNMFGNMLTSGKEPTPQDLIGGVAGMLPGPIGGIVSSLGGMLTSGKEPTPQDLIGGIANMIPGGLPGPVSGMLNTFGGMLSGGQAPSPQQMISGVASMIPGKAGGIIGQLGNMFGGMLSGGQAPSPQEMISGIAGMIPGEAGNIVNTLGNTLSMMSNINTGKSGMDSSNVMGTIGQLASSAGQLTKNDTISTIGQTLNNISQTQQQIATQQQPAEQIDYSELIGQIISVLGTISNNTDNLSAMNKILSERLGANITKQDIDNAKTSTK